MLTLTSMVGLGVFACSYGYGRRGVMPHAFGYDGFFPFLGILKILVFLGLLALIVYLVIKVSKEGFGTGSTSGKALEVLKERYAKGEITEEEYKKMKKEILG